MRSKKQSDVVSASEIAAWEWCPESWRLETLGHAPVNTQELARGTSFHQRTAAAEVISRKATARGRWLVATGLVGAVLAALILAAAGR